MFRILLPAVFSASPVVFLPKEVMELSVIYDTTEFIFTKINFKYGGSPPSEVKLAIIILISMINKSIILSILVIYTYI